MDDLEQRIAAALSSADIASTELSALVAETEGAIAVADQTAEEERAKALDPALSPDPKQARAALEDAEFAAQRLKTLQPRLDARYREAAAREYSAAWRADFERVEARRDELAAELREVYPSIVERLLELLARIPAIDREVSHINGSAPPDVPDRLRTVEQAARGVDGFGINGLFSFADGLKLPKFESDGDRYQFAYPPPQPNLAAQMVGMPIPSHPGANWHEALDDRDRRRREESERLSAYYEKREREAEKRREAELREGREAHRRQHGW